jgi:cytochrome c551/c552
MKRIALLVSALFLTGSVLVISCSENKSGGSTETSTGTTDQSANNGTTENTSANETHGTEVKPGDVQLTTPLNAEWVAQGKAIYDMKCQSCHKLTDEKVVGPGWKGVTQKREPHWIMNMITNVDMMLEKDPEAQKLLEQCLVRMPNQNVSKDEARSILEFMRQNDGVK